jgi:holo-[acyl-carrier protein] synthase
LQMIQARIGVDIIEIRRVQSAISRWGDRFLRRVYTSAELEIYRNNPESLAARFAGKEAVMKALAGDTTFFKWLDIEILALNNGRPTVTLTGEALDRGQELGINQLEISLSHSRDNAIAMVIGLTNL